MKKLILASASPRRKELLSQLGYVFDVVVSDYYEKVFSNNPVEVAKTFAFEKAQSVFNGVQEKNNVVVLGVDTVVYYNGEILMKEENRNNAFETLKKLSGKKHTVISGFSIITNDNVYTDYDLSEVVFNDLSDEDINKYLDSELYKGKAGCYGIQDGYSLVKEYHGSLNNVIGLPTEKIINILDVFLR